MSHVVGLLLDDENCFSCTHVSSTKHSLSRKHQNHNKNKNKIYSFSADFSFSNCRGRHPIKDEAFNVVKLEDYMMAGLQFTVPKLHNV